MATTIPHRNESLENSWSEATAEWTGEEPQGSQVISATSKVSVLFYRLEHDRVSQHHCQHLALSACVISDECLCVPGQKSSLFLQEETWGKKPPENHILLEVDFTAACPVHKSFYLVLCSEKRTQILDTSVARRYGAASPLGR